MRPSGDPDWYEQRARVPLTGREPLLGRLQQRLRGRAASWGWVTLQGPRGSGASRMLDEFEILMRATGRAAPLRIVPVPDDRGCLEPLRGALQGVFRARQGLALERGILRLCPHDPLGVRVLARWLDEREARNRPAPDPGLARDLLERVVPAGPVLVDRLEELDDRTLSVLLPSSQERGPGVLATIGGATGALGGGTVWSLEPLGPGQVELLLRRWLRHPVTARRLAPVLTERCGGWPGRIVQAVRHLRRHGHLSSTPRGAALISAPQAWPDGTEDEDAFRAWIEDEGPQVRRVLDLAAVSEGPLDIRRLAAAAGVKPRLVRAMLDEAVAARGGIGGRKFFVTRGARRAWRARQSPDRLADAHRRLEAVDAARVETPTRYVCPGRHVIARAAQHEGLADRAEQDGRGRAADAHRARAARLHLAAGDLSQAAVLLAAVGDQAIRRGRLFLALGPLELAGEIHRLHGDAPRAAEAWYRLGRVLGWQQAHDRATERLSLALRAAETSGHGRYLPRIHLALAASHRGCGDLHRERHHAELAAALSTTALGRIQAAAVLARADLRAGKPGAERLLARCEGDLRQAGFHDEADRARAALVDARLRAGDTAEAAAIVPPGPEKALERLSAARVDLAAGRFTEACSTFELLGADGGLPADLRATCYAHLAMAFRRAGNLPEARAAAVAASALLHVGQRSRSDDIRLHDVLARVFRGVGDDGRAVGHRSQARRGMRTLLREARDPREGRRLIRSLRRRRTPDGRQAS